MKFGSLFAGIGGIDLGLERAGMECAWQVEPDDFCQKVLTKHWPDVPKYGDIRDVGKRNLETVDLISGGFPCQDVSLAGKRMGLEGERSTLWSEFYRIICEIRPEWVLIENVPGLLSSDNGKFFRTILWNLSKGGYDAEWQTLSAKMFGAIHRRERLFIIANNNRKRIKRCWQEKVYRVEAFSWCKDVRGLEDLLSRPDIPEPLVCGKSNGISLETQLSPRSPNTSDE